MRRVFAARYAHRSAGPTLPTNASPGVTRRMTWLQKSAMEALEALQPLPSELPIYFATQFGEVDATIAVADSILARQLPVSPTAFQHSVHNAVAGYLTIATKSHSPSLTVSAGFASFDKLLFWTFHALKAGRLDEVLLAHASEHLAPGCAAYAACELLLLSTDTVHAPSCKELRSIERLNSRADLATLMKDLQPYDCQEFHEPPHGVASTPLRLDRCDGNFHRIVTSFEHENGDLPFEAFVSTWSRPA